MTETWHRVYMVDRIVTALRPHSNTISHLVVRDPLIVIASGLLLCALCWHLGHPVVAAVVAVVFCTSELVLWAIVTRLGPFRALGQGNALLVMLVLCTTNIIIYATPALYLASDPSFAMKVTGLLFVLGMQVYIANTWSRVPIFLYSMLLPSMGMLGLTFMSLADTDPVASSMTHWAIAIGFLFLFIYASIDTLRSHIATGSDLFLAQRDAAQRLSQLEELHRQDTLTGLLNRPAFDASLSIMLIDRASVGGEIAVCLIDLDAFKPINDTYSHEAGDLVLRQVARRIEAHVGDSGIVGRLGGDEFVIAVQGLDDIDVARAFADILGQIIAEPILWNDKSLKTSASIGLSMTGTCAAPVQDSVSGLCSAADQAMFAAKSSPSGGPVIYERHLFAPRMTPSDKQALIAAIDDRNLRPHYQPKVHLPTGDIIGFEALARWNFQGDTTRSPDVFLKQISELGLQGDFMIAIATQVIEDIEDLLSRGLDPGQVSLNLSEVALATYTGREDLLNLISDHPDAARHLTFEITEDVFIARASDTIQASISSFRALGVRISLDDFGTGFASFHHLRQLEFDELKIDTSFVSSLGFDSTSEVLVRGFLSIASGLGVTVVAEGVETEDQRRDLINMGCMTAQGYLFSRAVPIEQATDLLSQQQAA